MTVLCCIETFMLRFSTVTLSSLTRFSSSWPLTSSSLLTFLSRAISSAFFATPSAFCPTFLIQQADWRWLLLCSLTKHLFIMKWSEKVVATLNSDNVLVKLLDLLLKLWIEVAKACLHITKVVDDPIENAFEAFSWVLESEDGFKVEWTLKFHTRLRLMRLWLFCHKFDQLDCVFITNKFAKALFIPY